MCDYTLLEAVGSIILPDSSVLAHKHTKGRTTPLVKRDGPSFGAIREWRLARLCA